MIRDRATGVPPVSYAQDARATCYSIHDFQFKVLEKLLTGEN